MFSKKFNIVVNMGLVTAILMVLVVPFAQVTQAATITGKSDTQSSQKISPATSSHVIKFTSPSGAPTAGMTIVVTFPSDFDFTSKTISTVTFTHGVTTGAETTETLAAAADGTNWGAAFSGTQNRILTLTAPTDGTGAASVAAGNVIIITLNSTNAINPTIAGSYQMLINGTFGDSGVITVQIVNDDQVAVSGTVSQTLSFALNANSVSLGTLSSSAVVSGSHGFIVATNAAGGMAVTVNGATLTSGAYTITPCTSGCTSTPTTEQFGINLVDNATPDVGAVASGSAPIGVVATGFGTIDNFKFVAGAATTIASSTGGINATSYTVSYIANISGATESGSYTTTLTYTATATF